MCTLRRYILKMIDLYVTSSGFLTAYRIIFVAEAASVIIYQFYHPSCISWFCSQAVSNIADHV